MPTHFYFHSWPGKALKAGLAILLAVISLGALGASAQSGAPQSPLPGPGGPQALAGSAFTYQGRLNDSGGTPINGACDFIFRLWDADLVGSQLGADSPAAGVTVSGGYFSAPVNAGGEFGAAAFTGQARWLEVNVRCPAGSGGYTALTPRQPLTPAPIAFALPGLYTQQNDISPNLIGGYWGNSVTDGVYGATISGGGEALCWDGITPCFNQITDRFGTIGGGSKNVADQHATVSGGYGNQAQGNSSTVSGGYGNIATSWYATVSGGRGSEASGAASTISGGYENEASGTAATVSGGYTNTASADSAAVGGGRRNEANGYGATVSGGITNTADLDYATVSGGLLNTASASAATVGGGLANTAGSSYTTVSGGITNTANHPYSAVGGGIENTAKGDAATVSGGNGGVASGDFSTVGGGYDNTANNWSATVGGGQGNTASGNTAFVGGGYLNTAAGDKATVGGGRSNQAGALFSTIGGGYDNNIPLGADYAAVGGGESNQAGGLYSTIPGGSNNTAQGTTSFAAGYNAQANHDGAFVWSDRSAGVFASTAANQFLVRAAGGVGIGTNATTPNALTIAGKVIAGGTGAPAGSGEPFVSRGSLSGISMDDRTVGESQRWVIYPDQYSLAFYADGADRFIVNTQGVVYFGGLGAAGSAALCRNGVGQLAYCSSSARYKTNISPLAMGLDVIEQLRPVTFDWKESGEADLGLVAEEVAKVAPLLTTRNAGGQIEGVKYDHINAVLVKAVQEQQEQIEDLEARLAALEQSQPGSAAALGADSPTGSAWLPIFAVTSALLLLAAGALLGILVAPRLGRRRAAEGDA